MREVFTDSFFFLTQGLKFVKDSCLEKFPHIPACCELSVKVLTFHIITCVRYDLVLCTALDSPPFLFISSDREG